MRLHFEASLSLFIRKTLRHNPCAVQTASVDHCGPLTFEIHLAVRTWLQFQGLNRMLNSHQPVKNIWGWVKTLVPSEPQNSC